MTSILAMTIADFGFAAQGLSLPKLDGVEVDGLFVQAPTSEQVLDVEMANYSATFSSLASNLTAAERSSELLIGTTVWYVIDIKPDGFDGTVLYLSEDPDV